MWIELHVNKKPLLFNTNLIASVGISNEGKTTFLMVGLSHNNFQSVDESYDALKAMLMPGYKKPDGMAARLREREEFFKK